MATLPPDAALVPALRDGDDLAFAGVFDLWSASMISLARSYVSTHASAEEVVQDTWLAVITGINGFAGRSSFKTWVYRILVNTAKRRGAHEQRVIPWSSLLSACDEPGPRLDGTLLLTALPGHRPPPASWAAPEPAALAREIREAVADALDELPDRQRAVLTLRAVHGHDPAEVCAQLGISAANQRVLLHRARTAARAHLAAYLCPASSDEPPPWSSQVDAAR